MTAPPEIDRAAGMEVYATSTPPCPATLRASDEDFQVDEIMREAEVLPDPAPGLLPLYRVEKRSIDTLHLAEELAHELKSRVRYMGIKDKRAKASQYFVPTSARAKAPSKVEGRNFTAELVGYVQGQLRGEMMLGNRFAVVMRRCCDHVEENLDTALGLCRAGKIPDFYGLQRFGTRDVLTHLVGKEIVKGRFKGALEVLLCRPRGSDVGQTAEARRMMQDGKFEGAWRLLPPGQEAEMRVARRLASKPEDLVGALRAVPISLRRLYVQAYQSYIYNRTLSSALRHGLDISRCAPCDNWGEVSADGLVLKTVRGVKEEQTPGAVPLIQMVGYSYRNYGSRFDACIEEVLGDEGVSAKEFYVKEMQEVSAEGGFRRAHLAAKELSYETEGDVARVGFVLARGGYATVLLREVIKPADPAAAGFS
jgi:tRNA pseudouridine13 synthase